MTDIKLNLCRSCGSQAKHIRSGVVNKIVCTGCACRVVAQDLDKIINIWNNGIPKDEDHAVIRCENGFIETEIIKC